MLISLRLQACRFWDDAAAAALVLGSLTAHRSLRTLSLGGNTLRDQLQAPALGAALGALVAADAPALQELHVSYIALLHDAGLLALGLLLDALPLNTHLLTLHLDDNRCTADFARDRLLPAVRANTSLRLLILPSLVIDEAFLHEAEALVAARATPRLRREAQRMRTSHATR
jgi:hypothetical protein